MEVKADSEGSRAGLGMQRASRAPSSAHPPEQTSELDERPTRSGRGVGG